MNTQNKSENELNGNYRIQLAVDSLNFQPFTVADPIPLGRQILAASGLDPRKGYSLFAPLPSGDFEEVRLDEKFDLRAKGTEQFIASLTDREFKLTLNGAELKWGRPFLHGSELYALAKPADGEAVFLEVPGGTDKLIEPTELISLDGSGIERFITAARPKPTFDIVVNARHRVLNDPLVTFEQLVALAFPGQHETNVVFTITYRNAASKPQGGNLAVGGSVTVQKEGSIFNVTRTVQS